MGVDWDAAMWKEDPRSRLIETVQNALAGSPAPGAGAAVLVDGNPLLAAGVGYRDLEKTQALDARAGFYIYSITKTLIAAVILRLVEQGRVALDASLHAFLPQVPVAAPVTIHQLLNHTAGIPDYGGLPEYYEQLRADPRHAWSSQKFLDVVLPRGQAFAPGQGWQYSNIGFLLLRRVIETVLDAPLRAAIQAHIAEPLRLTQTFVAETLEDAQHLTPGYSGFFQPDDSLEDIRHRYHPGWVSHGVVISTAAEVALMLDGILAGPLLNAESRSAMLDPVRVETDHALFQDPSYGLGVMIDPRSRYGLLAGHGGGGPGYLSGALHLPSVKGRRVTCAALCNCDQDDLGLQIAFDLAMAVGDMLRD